jgi:hypothetical protein
MIVKKGQRYEVRSKNGRRRLGSYRSRKEAEARLRQIEYFQRTKKPRLAIPEELE